jgi:Ca2+-binding RTX toxin-like protein
MGNDSLTGGAGADVFRLPSEPWAPIHITDFTPGQDKLDLSALFKASGYTGSDPIGDHYMYVESDGAGGSVLRFDRDAGGSNPVWPNTIVDWIIS